MVSSSYIIFYTNSNAGKLRYIIHICGGRQYCKYNVLKIKGLLVFG